MHNKFIKMRQIVFERDNSIIRKGKILLLIGEKTEKCRKIIGPMWINAREYGAFWNDFLGNNISMKSNWEAGENGLYMIHN